MTRDELVELVGKILQCAGTEGEIDDMIALLQSNVLDPKVTDLIYWPQSHPRVPEGLTALTPEEIVDIALLYEPVIVPTTRSDDE